LSGETLTEGMEILRSMIERIILKPNKANTELIIDLHGDMAGILSVASGQDNVGSLLMGFNDTQSSVKTDHPDNAADEDDMQRITHDVGAWIETLILIISHTPVCVAPRVGAHNVRYSLFNARGLTLDL
jgi:hypothetical protein